MLIPKTQVQDTPSNGKTQTIDANGSGKKSGRSRRRSGKKQIGVAGLSRTGYKPQNETDADLAQLARDMQDGHVTLFAEVTYGNASDVSAANILSRNVEIAVPMDALLQQKTGFGVQGYHSLATVLNLINEVVSRPGMFRVPAASTFDAIDPKLKEAWGREKPFDEIRGLVNLEQGFTYLDAYKAIKSMTLPEEVKGSKKGGKTTLVIRFYAFPSQEVSGSVGQQIASCHADVKPTHVIDAGYDFESGAVIVLGSLKEDEIKPMNRMVAAAAGMVLPLIDSFSPYTARIIQLFKQGWAGWEKKLITPAMLKLIFANRFEVHDLWCEHVLEVNDHQAALQSFRQVRELKTRIKQLKVSVLGVNYRPTGSWSDTTMVSGGTIDSDRNAKPQAVRERELTAVGAGSSYGEQSGFSAS